MYHQTLSMIWSTPKQVHYNVNSACPTCLLNYLTHMPKGESGSDDVMWRESVSGQSTVDNIISSLITAQLESFRSETWKSKSFVSFIISLLCMWL